MSLKEAYLHDYLAASLVGIAFAAVVSIPASSVVGNWGPFIGVLVIVGLFGFVPGGFVAGYLNFRLHQMGENLEMAGLSAGFFTAVVYAIIQLFVSLASAIIFQAAAAAIFIAYALSVLFAFIFFMIGGYISGMMERSPFAMPGFFNLSRVRREPPPPPGAPVQVCPNCGQQLTFVQQYGRWYCANCKKYP